jgi:hypothetical protein
LSLAFALASRWWFLQIILGGKGGDGMTLPETRRIVTIGYFPLVCQQSGIERLYSRTEGRFARTLLH